MRASVSIPAFLLALLFSSGGWADDNLFIESVQIRGTARHPQLQTQARQKLDRTRLQGEVRRLWATGWFEDIRVEATETPAGLQLVFTVVEKPRLYLRRVVFEPTADRVSLDFLAPGSTIDRPGAAQVAAALRGQLVEKGYAHAQVDAELLPAGFQQANLLLRVERGPRYRVAQVRFSGSPGVELEELRDMLRATRVRRRLPGLPGLWRGWWVHPPFSEQGLQEDLDRLRSFYLSRGYFKARVALAGVSFSEDKATITIFVRPGPRYRVRTAEVAGAETGPELGPRLGGDFPAAELCRTLLRARQEAERRGHLDFAAQIEIEPMAEPPWALLEQDEAGAPPKARLTPHLFRTELAGREKWVAATAIITAGPPYTVGRIEFRGHHFLSDATLRRAWQLHEGDMFDARKLRRSLAHLNRLGFFKLMTEDAVELERDPEARCVNLIVRLRERPRGRWALSGPLGPVSWAGPLQFSLGSRLPAWGRGPLELSTYYAAFSLVGFSPPLAQALSLVPRTRWEPLLAIERPYLPGQAWQSGFRLAPQLGWQGILASYGLTQAQNAALTTLTGEPASPGLRVPVAWRADDENSIDTEPAPAGFLSCEAPKPRWAWLRAVGATALEWLLAARPL